MEIIRYQVLIPVTEVQVRASSAKDMDSHFLWELIHLRSQLQRRSEKVYVLSNSTADFRNAFLKTIRQIIRESVRNMSIPMKGFGSSGSVSGISSQGGGSGSSQTLERPKQQVLELKQRNICIQFIFASSLYANFRFYIADNNHSRLADLG